MSLLSLQLLNDLKTADAVAGHDVIVVIRRRLNAMFLFRDFPCQSISHRVVALGHPEVRDMHDLRTRISGTNAFIQFHLVLDSEITLLRAHEIADEVEADVRNAFPAAEVIIHQDPEGIEEDTPSFEP